MVSLLKILSRIALHIEIGTVVFAILKLTGVVSYPWLVLLLPVMVIIIIFLLID